MLWEEDDAKQIYLVLKVSCRQTNNLSARYNDHQKIYSIMVSLIRRHLCRVHFHSFQSLASGRDHYLT